MNEQHNPNQYPSRATSPSSSGVAAHTHNPTHERADGVLPPNVAAISEHDHEHSVPGRRGVEWVRASQALAAVGQGFAEGLAAQIAQRKGRDATSNAAKAAGRGAEVPSTSRLWGLGSDVTGPNQIATSRRGVSHKTAPSLPPVSAFGQATAPEPIQRVIGLGR